MANGSHDASPRRDLFCRKTAGRRLLILGWIAAAGLPAVPHANAQQPAITPPATEAFPVSRAIALGQPQRADAVAQTAGGVLGQLFGSSSSASSKEKDDGRRAYPLPPPDPASVDWNGVPYHSPKPGAIASSASAEDQPIRDTAADSDTRRSAATATRSTAAGSITDSPIPKPPRSGEAPAGVASARIAAALPLPPASLPSDSAVAELSTNSSSRRSGRRPIDPLSSEELLPATVKGQAERTRPGNDFQSVARREIAAADTTPADAQAKPQDPLALSAPTAPSDASSASTTAAPPSLAAIDAEMASQQTEDAGSGKETASKSAAQGTVDRTAAKPPARVDAAVPSPVSRTQPMIPAVGAQAYPPETIAAELSPLRPMQGTDSKANEADAEAYIGSGVAASSTPVPSDVPTATATADTATSILPPVAAESPLLAEATITADDQDLDANTASEPIAFVARGQAREPSQAPASSSKSKQLAASEMPGIRVITEGPAEILIRELTQYEVRVENRGAVDARGVVVRTSLPPWAEVKGHNVSQGVIQSLSEGSEDSAGQLEWTLDNLPAGVVERLFVRIQPTGAGSFEVATNWTTSPQTHTAQVTVREPKLSIQIEGPDEIIYGQSQKYRVRVLNPGDAVASNVLFTLAPEVGDPVQQAIGNIPAGKESSFEIELTARDLGQLKINGSASADLDLTAAAKKSVVVAAAKIEATLSGPSLKFQNTDAAYQLQLTNSGRADSESIRAEVRLPAGTKYLGGIEGASVKEERLSWVIDSLPAGETKQYDFTCKMQRTGNHPIAFQCEGSAAGRARVEIETAVQAIADLKLSVIDPPAPAPVGAEVAYEVLIHNRGSKAAEDIRVVAQFGNGIEPVRVEGHLGDVVTGQVLFNPIQRIDAGDQLQLKIAAKADRAGDHRFRVEVKSGESVLVAEEATVFVEARNERISRSSSEPASR